jgi:hypothetical protein
MTSTPIEDRADWSRHRTAVIAARSAGLCWWCAQLVGFAKTAVPTTTPELCPRCRATHPSQPVTAEVSSCR